MDQNVLLDMLELIAEEKRINETRAFSSRDAFEKARFQEAARRDAAAISNITRKLARQGRSRRRLPSSERQFDAYIDRLLDTCFESGITHATRDAPADDTLHARPSH
jgi:hypothetical protein